GPIPVGPFAVIGDDSIGRGIVETLSSSRSKAVLMQNHGPFTIGSDARAAVKAAVMVEGVARTVHISHQLGEPLPTAQHFSDSHYDRYQNAYAHARCPRETCTPPTRRGAAVAAHPHAAGLRPAAARRRPRLIRLDAHAGPPPLAPLPGRPNTPT